VGLKVRAPCTNTKGPKMLTTQRWAVMMVLAGRQTRVHASQTVGSSPRHASQQARVATGHPRCTIDGVEQRGGVARTGQHVPYASTNFPSVLHRPQPSSLLRAQHSPPLSKMLPIAAQQLPALSSTVLSQHAPFLSVTPVLQLLPSTLHVMPIHGASQTHILFWHVPWPLQFL
jgi:hypothetical protein